MAIKFRGVDFLEFDSCSRTKNAWCVTPPAIYRGQPHPHHRGVQPRRPLPQGTGQAHGGSGTLWRQPQRLRSMLRPARLVLHPVRRRCSMPRPALCAGAGVSASVPLHRSTPAWRRLRLSELRRRSAVRSRRARPSRPASSCGACGGACSAAASVRAGSRRARARPPARCRAARAPRRSASSRAACSPRRRRAARRRPGSAARATCLTSFAAFSSCRWPREFASAPSSRFASGYSLDARRSCTLRVARASRHVQRARIWSGASGLPSAIARSRTRMPARRSFSHVGACVTSVTRSSKSARSTRIETRSCSAIMRSRRFGFSAAQVARNCSSAPLRRAALGQLLHERRALVEADLAPGDRRPVALLVLVEEARVDALPLALDHGDAAADVRRDRDEPRRRREPAAGAALRAAARRGRDARALAVEVGVEQRVQRDDALVVRRALRDEVDDDARLLARVQAHDPADALLVDALRRGRREVHADRRARRVPAFGEQLRVDQHVDLAALVGGERLREADRRRAARRRPPPSARRRGTPARGCTRGRRRPRRRCPACCRSGRGRGSRRPGSAPDGRASWRGSPGRSRRRRSARS